MRISYRQVGIDLPHRFAHGTGHRQGRSSGSQCHVHSAERRLFEGEIDLGADFRIQPLLMNVPDDPHHLAGELLRLRLRAHRQREALSDGLFTREEPLRRSFAKQHRERSTGSVGRGEGPPAEQRDPQGAEVLRGGRPDVGNCHLPLARPLTVGAVVAHHHRPAPHRETGDGADRGDARAPLEPLDQSTVECTPGGFIRVAGGGEGEIHRQYTRGTEAGVDLN